MSARKFPHQKYKYEHPPNLRQVLLWLDRETVAKIKELYPRQLNELINRFLEEVAQQPARIVFDMPVAFELPNIKHRKAKKMPKHLAHIWRMDPDTGKFIEGYRTLKETVKLWGGSITGLSIACKYERKYKGFGWKYNEPEPYEK